MGACFEDAERNMQEFAHLRTDNLHSCLAALTQTLGELFYPRVVLEGGDLSVVKSKKNANSGFWHYADSFSYNAASAVTSMQLGNGRWESTTFNSRLQPTQIALGSTNGATNLLKLDYEYGTTASANNGNVTKQTITVPSVGSNNGFVAVQAYSYDSLNRLKDATEMVTPNGGSQTQSWKQTFTFDRYGNRRFDFTNGNTTMPLANCTEAICNPTIGTSNNRLSSTGWGYDLSGNTAADPQGRTFVYDGENKQVLVSDTNGTIGEYFYDGDGRRVKKHVPSTGETTVFVYDAAGKLIEEYSTVVASTNDAKVAYLTNDHLGSPRINTDANGAVTARHDYHPFGEEIATSQRGSGLGYATDTVRNQFTGYERDNETELDFAQARYLANSFGRFSSPDPLQASARARMPQTWNRYTYALNNPLRFVDPDGMDVNVLDEKAKNLLLKTLPEEIRAKVQAAIEKGKGNLTKGALDKIKSKDENFAALKVLVNSKEITEVATASVGQMGVPFFKTTRDEQREKDIQNYLKDNPDKSRADAEALITADGDPSDVLGYYGQTFTPSGEEGTEKSPSGNLRAVATDQTGEGAGISEEEAVMAMGHELYNHTYKFRIGDKTWLNETSADVKAIEARTIRNYRGEQKKNNPANLKPRQ
jgi:RHS repeat-associated protein